MNVRVRRWFGVLSGLRFNWFIRLGYGELIIWGGLRIRRFNVLWVVFLFFVVWRCLLFSVRRLCDIDDEGIKDVVFDVLLGDRVDNMLLLVIDEIFNMILMIKDYWLRKLEW